MFHTAYLLLGSNMGNRQQYIDHALDAIARLENTIIFSKSDCHETAAWGKEDLPPHINIAIGITTTMDALTLLERLQKIELDLDRTRQTKWGERTMDIDIIYFNEDIIHEPTLTIPHPLMQDRRFVLSPLCDIASHITHPVLGMTTQALLQQCADTLSVKKILAPHFQK